MKKHTLTFDDRVTIERLYESENSIPFIAEKVGVHIATIYRELKKGQTGLLNRNGVLDYDAEVAQKKVEENYKNRSLKTEAKKIAIARQYFRQLGILNEKIKDQQEKVDSFRSKARSIKSPNTSGINVDGSKKQDARYTAYIQKAVDLEKEIEMEWKDYVDLEFEIEEIIDKTDCYPKWKTIVRSRYLDFLSWEKIEEKTGISRDWLYKIRNEVLKKVEIPDDFKSYNS